MDELLREVEAEKEHILEIWGNIGSSLRTLAQGFIRPINWSSNNFVWTFKEIGWISSISSFLRPWIWNNIRLSENPWKIIKYWYHFGKKKMIRGEYEAYLGRSHLSADRQGRQTLLFPKSHWWLYSCPTAGGPARRQAWGVSFRTIADFKLVPKSAIDFWRRIFLIRK